MTAQQEREQQRAVREDQDRPEAEAGAAPARAPESGNPTPGLLREPGAPAPGVPEPGVPEPAEPGAGSAPVPPSETPASESPASEAPATAPASAAGAPPGPPAGQETDPVAEMDRLGRRMDRAVGGFVDDPRRAVKDADAVLEETVERLARLLAERRRELRESWNTRDGEAAGTEELRIALTRYRDMTRHLLTVA
ncbi:hypothetical protein [Streptomyces sp. HPF1205]|uniref:hypothetical protein n=1 Tax=Streptomyces sp. HPF1205 TaxID=2873262 RepID=UPI001CED2B64|nr:hypothetical protein [Streptomyces sp. HPF1205]